MNVVHRPTRSWRARAGVAVLGLALALVPALPAAPAAAAAPSVQLVSLTSHTEAGAVLVAGQVVNHTGHTVDWVPVALDLLNAKGALVGSRTAYAQTSSLDDGELSGFSTVFEAPAGYDHLSVRSVGGSASAGPANRNFTTTVTNHYVDSGGVDHLVGTVRNTNAGRASLVSVDVTYLDGNGRAIGAEQGFPEAADGSDYMAAGETDSFDITYDGPSTPASYVLLADSLDDPSPLPTTSVSSGGGTRAYGQSAAIAGRVTKRGTDTGLDAVDVQLLAQTAGSATWGVALTGRTDHDGKVSFSPKPARNTTYVIRLPAAATRLGSQSSGQAVVVNALDTAKLSSASLAVGRTATLTATVAPTQAGRTVTLQRLVSGKWTNIASHALDSRSSWVFPLKPTARGTYTYRTTTGAYAANGAGASAQVTLKVT